jgi:hypothetical protein
MGMDYQGCPESTMSEAAWKINLEECRKGW